MLISLWIKSADIVENKMEKWKARAFPCLKYRLPGNCEKVNVTYSSFPQIRLSDH